MITSDSVEEQTLQKESNSSYPFSSSNSRFLIVLIFTIQIAWNNFLQSIYFELKTIWTLDYEVSLSTYQLPNLITPLVAFLPANIAANWIIPTFGIKISLILASFISLTGFWLTCLMDHGFGWVLAGQVLVAIAIPFFYSLIPTISSRWFAATERPYATAFMIAGITIGSFLPTIFSNSIVVDGDVTKTSVVHFMIYAASVYSVCFILMVVFLKEKPLTSPSKADAIERLNLFKSLETICTDRNILIMLGCSAIIASIYAYCYSLMSGFLFQINTNFKLTGNIITVGILIPLAGLFAGAFVIHITKKYQLLILVSSSLAGILFAFNYLFYQNLDNTLFYMTFVAFAFLTGPIRIASLEYGVDLSFPATESLVGGIWVAINQAFILIQNALGDAVIPQNNYSVEWSFIYCVLWLVVSIIPLLFIRNVLKRTNYENNNILASENSLQPLELTARKGLNNYPL